MKDRKLGDLRKDFAGRELDVASLPDHPFPLMQQWIEEALASGDQDANVMCLATVSPKGFPSARYVLLKDLDERGLVFFTNYESRKAIHLDSNPNAAVSFYWSALGRQLRIEGRTEKVSEEESDDYFLSRPLVSRINALISPQSREIPDRDYLLNLQQQALKKHGDSGPQRPAFWGGYRLIPVWTEFWQGGPARLHDRIVYCLFEQKWKRKRLAP